MICSLLVRRMTFIMMVALSVMNHDNNVTVEAVHMAHTADTFSTSSLLGSSKHISCIMMIAPEARSMPR